MPSPLPERLRALLDLPEDQRIIGAFRLKQQLGRGGFAPVWLADEIADTITLRQAAIKLFAIDPRLGEQDRHDIIAEAGRLCRVEHPNIVRFYSLPVDERRGVIGLAMEYVGGESLATRLRAEERIPVREAVDVGIAVASALVAVHAAGLVHRDIWPANVIEDRTLRGSPAAYKLIDFGIAVPDARIPNSRAAPTSSSPMGQEAWAGKRGYVDPVCFRGEALPTSQSDLYALGALLFVCLTGRIPAASTGSLEDGVLSGEKRPAPVSELQPDAPEALVRLVAELLDPEPAGRPGSVELAVVELERIRGTFLGRSRALPPEDEGPFRGLSRFEREHRDVFFGRRVEVATALDVLRTRGLLALVGPSGSGKSSLARAGILPALEEGALGGPQKWDMVVVSPGVDPRHALNAELVHMELPASAGAEEAAARVEAWLAENRRGLVLLVDQLEELATLAKAGDKLTDSRVFMMDLLARLGERARPGVRVIVTARRDMLDPILAHPKLGRALIRGTALVAPLDSAEWGLVIDASLESYGYTFEDPRLRAKVMASLERSPGAMPLVEFALSKLWRERDRDKKQITWASWDKLGGVAGALNQHAEATMYPGGNAAVAPAKLKRLLLELITPSGARATREPFEITQGDADAEKALRMLEEARLVVREGDGVTLAHEALLSHWDKLKAWVDEEKESLLLLEDLERVARLWSETRDDELLFRRRRILLVDEVLRRHDRPLLEPAQAFYKASRAAARRSRLMAASAALVGVLVVVILREKYASLEAQRIDQVHRAQQAELQGKLEKAGREKVEAELTVARAEKDAVLAFAEKRLQEALARPPLPTGDVAKEPRPIDPGVLKEIEQYVIERRREDSDMPEPLKNLLVEGDAKDAKAAPPDRGAGVKTAPSAGAQASRAAAPVARGAAFAALWGAKQDATACSKETGPHGTGKVALVLDPSGKVTSVAMDAQFVRTNVGQCVDAAFRRMVVPAFDGNPLTIVWSFTVP